MKVQGCAFSFWLATATASYSGNLNYRSPSSEHPALGLDLVKITKRNLAKRDVTEWDTSSLNFTHSVASVSETALYVSVLNEKGRSVLGFGDLVDTHCTVVGERYF